MNDLIEPIRSNPDAAALLLLIVLLVPDARLLVQRVTALDTAHQAAPTIELQADAGTR